jgi:hypothetical protein
MSRKGYFISMSLVEQYWRATDCCRASVPLGWLVSRYKAELHFHSLLRDEFGMMGLGINPGKCLPSHYLTISQNSICACIAH